MPHNMSGEGDMWDLPRDPSDADQPVEVDLDAGSGGAPEPAPGTAWLVTPPSPGDEPSLPPGRRPGGVRRVPLRAWAGLAAVAAVLVGVVAAVHAPHRPVGGGTGAVTASTVDSAASVAAGACAGLSGTVVTDDPGDPATVPGVIATFEDAYYTQRSAEAAMKVIAPEAGITQQALADGIATVPVGTTYCVAITPVTLNTATVHIAETHPDGKRVDYLQVINTIPAPAPGGSLLISHFQAQG